MPLEDLSLFIAKAGKNRSPRPDAIASEVKKAARESYRIRPELASSITFILASIHRNIAALIKSLKRAKQSYPR